MHGEKHKKRKKEKYQSRPGILMSLKDQDKMLSGSFESREKNKSGQAGTSVQPGPAAP